MGKSYSHVIAVDDAPFRREHRGDVRIVGVVFSGPRLEGVLSSKVRRDGANATRRVADMVFGCRFASQVQAVMLQGIAFAGFNVVDIHRLSQELAIPVLVVARNAPDMEAIRDALLTKVPGGTRKWGLIEKAGPMEAMENLWVQRAGLDEESARLLLRQHARHGHLPEPLRTAHLIAGGITNGESRHRA